MVIFKIVILSFFLSGLFLLLNNKHPIIGFETCELSVGVVDQQVQDFTDRDDAGSKT